MAGQRADHRRDQGEVTKPPQQAAHHIAPNFFTPSKAEELRKSERGKEKQRNPEVGDDESVSCRLAAVL